VGEGEGSGKGGDDKGVGESEWTGGGVLGDGSGEKGEGIGLTKSGVEGIINRERRATKSIKSIPNRTMAIPSQFLEGGIFLTLD
jgi:hypothetical protein